MNDQLVFVVGAACWAIVVMVWIAGALYNARYAPEERIRPESGPVTLNVATFLVCSMILFLGRGVVQNLSVDAAWVRFLGVAVLIASTVFALWARSSLGTSWSIAPEVGGDRRLRTEGPYAVTRHPIYTGLLGMILGTALLAGLGQAILAVVAGLIVFSVKIHQEEQLLLATFPEGYPAYRKRVPRLIPGLGRRSGHPSRQRQGDSSDRGS
jgi:protein-S-isoprenylcysteine O-methyltransferase Ste14